MLLSLFCGPGGLDLGFENAGFEVGLAFDIRSSSVLTYNQNRETMNNGHVADISKLSISTLDDLYGGIFEPTGIIGGPPCQSFSMGNVHKKKDDIRSVLPLSYAKLLKQLNERSPIQFFVFENVKGLLSAKHRNEFLLFKKRFEK